MKGHYGLKHYARRIMPQGMSPPYQSNATFHAASIGAIYLVEIAMLGGLFSWQSQKKCFKHYKWARHTQTIAVKLLN